MPAENLGKGLGFTVRPLLLVITKESLVMVKLSIVLIVATIVPVGAADLRIPKKPIRLEQVETPKPNLAEKKPKPLLERMPMHALGL